MLIALSAHAIHRSAAFLIASFCACANQVLRVSGISAQRCSHLERHRYQAFVVTVVLVQAYLQWEEVLPGRQNSIHLSRRHPAPLMFWISPLLLELVWDGQMNHSYVPPFQLAHRGHDWGSRILIEVDLNDR